MWRVLSLCFLKNLSIVKKWHFYEWKQPFSLDHNSNEFIFNCCLWGSLVRYSLISMIVLFCMVIFLKMLVSALKRCRPDLAASGKSYAYDKKVLAPGHYLVECYLVRRMDLYSKLWSPASDFSIKSWFAINFFH